MQSVEYLELCIKTFVFPKQASEKKPNDTIRAGKDIQKPKTVTRRPASMTPGQKLPLYYWL